MKHLLHSEKIVERIEQVSQKNRAYFFGEPATLLILSGMIMLLVALSYLMRFKTKWVAMILIAVLIPITIPVQVGQIAATGSFF
jgi:putative oxidoreductase